MTEMPITEEAANRFAHIIDQRDANLAGELLGQCVSNIENNTGSPSGSLRILISHAEVSAMASWYQNGDLAAFKNWLYARGKLEYILMHEPYNETGGVQAYESWALRGLFYLVSGHSGLIEWYAGVDEMFDARRTNDVRVFDFWTKQFFIALRGEWDILVSRCERIIANPPKGSREKKFLIDHQYYLALAKGDVDGMVSIIKELTSQKLIARRISLEGGFSANLICTPAVLYSKLAWMRGYQIIVDSPYIPKDWLPISPLTEYTDPYDFMRKREIVK
ncbi:hypothetical protein AAHK20_13455 [Trinickia sp. YCB016]